MDDQLDPRLTCGTLLERHGEWSLWDDAIAKDGGMKPGLVILNPNGGSTSWFRHTKRAMAHWASIKATK